MADADHAGARRQELGGPSVTDDLSAVVEAMTRKAREAGFIAGMALFLPFSFPPRPSRRMDTDRVTGFARAPVQSRPGPAAKRSPSASHYSSRSSASARARSSALIWRPATRTS